jgi:DNA polymerase III delta subunit
MMGRGYLRREQFDRLPTLPPAVLFTGDRFYLELYRRRLKGELERRGEVVTLYPDQIEPEKIRELLLQPSLFGGVEGVIGILDRWKGELGEIGKGVERGHLLLFHYGSDRIDPRKFPVVVRFFPPDEQELRQFIRQRAQELGLYLPPDLVELLITRVDPAGLEQELQKLSLYPGELNREIGELLIFPHREESFEELFYRFLEGRPEGLEGLLELGEHHGYPRLFGLLLYYLRELFRVYLYIEETGNSQLKGLYNYQLPVKVERRRVEMALRLRPHHYQQLLEVVLKLQLQAREGKGEVRPLVKGGLAAILNLLHPPK